MTDSFYTYQNVSYTVRPVQTEHQVILFKVLRKGSLSSLLELQLLYGWIDKRLVELTARDEKNATFMDACSTYIIGQYKLQ